MENNSNSKTTLGIDENIEAGIGALIPIVGLIFYFIEKESRFVRFFSMQSIIIGVLMFAISILTRIIGIIPILGALIGMVLGLVNFGLFICLIIIAVKGFQHSYYKLPVVGDFAESMIGNK